MSILYEKDQRSIILTIATSIFLAVNQCWPLISTLICVLKYLTSHKRVLEKYLGVLSYDKMFCLCLELETLIFAPFLGCEAKPLRVVFFFFFLLSSFFFLLDFTQNSYHNWDLKLSKPSIINLLIFWSQSNILPIPWAHKSYEIHFFLLLSSLLYPKFLS